MTTSIDDACGAAEAVAADESGAGEAVAAATASASVMDSVKLARMVLRRLRCATSLRIWPLACGGGMRSCMTCARGVSGVERERGRRFRYANLLLSVPHHRQREAERGAEPHRAGGERGPADADACLWTVRARVWCFRQVFLLPVAARPLADPNVDHGLPMVGIKRLLAMLTMQMLFPGAAAWFIQHRLRVPQTTASRLNRAIVMCKNPNEEQSSSLNDALKKAAAQKLGVSMEDAMKPEDVARYRAGASAMEKALREAKERLAVRKSEVGEEAALEELDAYIRGAGREEAPPVGLTVRPKLFLLDRDGCLNQDVGAPGVVRVADLRLIPGSAGALRRLRLAGKVAIVTNQSARGKGLLSAAELDAIHEELRHQIARTARGGLAGKEQWDGLYVCEDAARSERKKPEPGMLVEALGDFDVEPSEAVMIGDSWSDVVARRAGCAGVLLATGHGACRSSAEAAGVGLPVTLKVDDANSATTDYLRLQQSVTSASTGSATGGGGGFRPRRCPGGAHLGGAAERCARVCGPVAGGGWLVAAHGAAEPPC